MAEETKSAAMEMPCGMKTENFSFPSWYEAGMKNKFDSDDCQTDTRIRELQDQIEAVANVQAVVQQAGGAGEFPSYDVGKDEKGLRGLAIIMTNDFNGIATGKPKPLPFVFKDGCMLWSVFRHLGFHVIWHINSRASEMISNLKGDVVANDVGKMVVCCISSHGQQSCVLGQDGKCVWIKEMVDTLGSHSDERIERKLRNKPKLFFVDACQGRYLKEATSEDETLIKFDVTQDFSQIAENADMLLGFAAYQGTPSLGIRLGSYYINELVKALRRYYTTQDIHMILVMVCREVQCIRLKGQENERQAQLPMFFSTLTKWLIMRNN